MRELIFYSKLNFSWFTILHCPSNWYISIYGFWLHLWVRVVAVNAANFNNISVISWRSVLLVEETEYPEKTTDLPCTSRWQTLSHYVVSNTPRHEWDSNSQR